MKLIVLIEDNEFHRRLAQRILSSRSGITIPESPADIGYICPCDVGLVIVDRMMDQRWMAARDAFLTAVRVVNPNVPIVEWSVAASLKPEDRLPLADMSVQKLDAAELLPVVDRWIRTGTIYDAAVAP